MINVMIDEFTPCLKDAKTGELVQTEVTRIKRKSFLRKYNKKNRWYVNWESLLDENEVLCPCCRRLCGYSGYGRSGKRQRHERSVHCRMCINPENNKLIADEIKYYGVGGHLFAIAAQKSIEYGFDGFMYGFAADKELLEHYVNVFNGEYIGVLHPYQFAIDEENAAKIMEVYDYEWTDEEI